MSPKPTVLVLGGVGFIGRKFVAYLTEHDLASEIRVVDKVLPQTAYLNKRCTAAFDQVEFMQGNLSSPGKKKKKNNEKNTLFCYEGSGKSALCSAACSVRKLFGVVFSLPLSLSPSFFLLLPYTLDQ